MNKVHFRLSSTVQLIPGLNNIILLPEAKLSLAEAKLSLAEAKQKRVPSDSKFRHPRLYSH